MSANYITTPYDLLLKNTDSFFDSVSLVPKAAETTIIEYTVPTGTMFCLLGGTATGKVDADFYLYVDGAVKELRRLSWTNRQVDFQSRRSVPEGKKIKITVSHNNIDPQNFDATIIGIFI